MSLLFQNILFSAGKPILKNLTSSIKLGKMTAIIGPSGCGKTTLSKILSGRFTNEYSGSIYYNGKLMKKKELLKLFAYVHQDDYFYESQTVEETVKFVSALRNKKIDTKIVERLNLENILKSKIGNSSKGISAGERKRVKILLELIDNKDAIFLDEPTSGLDSLNALNLVKLLKSLNMTTCCVLHQPSSQMFFMFDEIIIMSQGNIVYQGSPSNIFAWFASLGKECPDHYNPADFIFTDILTNLQYTNTYQEHTPTQETESTKQSRLPKNKISQYKEIKLLTKRNISDFCRNKSRGLAKIFQSIFTSLIVCYIFYDTYKKEYDVKIKNLQGALYYYGLNIFFSTVFSNFSDFYYNEIIVERELQAGCYSFASYFACKVLFDTVTNIFHPIFLVSSASLCMKYDQGAYKLFIVYLVCILTALIGHSVSVLIASLSSTAMTASAVVSAVSLPLTLISGLIVDPESMFIVLKILQYISPTRHSFNALIKNEFSDIKDNVMIENLVTGFIGIWQSIMFMVLIYVFNISLSFILLKKKIYKRI
ncbi:hypothetical protein BDAP_001257 [Binucleata daphniae]